MMQVLFVEDDPMNRRVVRDMLLVAGIDMIEAHEALSGLEMIEKLDLDLVLMDLRMPGMDGLTAVERIRARADSKSSLPIIVITADTAPGLRDECLARGASEVLFKPVAMQDLFDVIGRVAAQRSTDAPLMF
jgi:CheY-like chemotaxis protein